MKRILTLSMIAATTMTAFAQLKQHKTSDAPFLKPAEAVAKMEIPDEFQIDIFAAEPDIGEPIAFTFDDRGRVWVVENYNYVDRRSHTDEKPLTRIQIFEDTDSDGVFDTKKLFTDKLTFSSGIAIGFGGVFVGTPPNLIFIPDADGDDQPDGEPQVLLDGWGIHDRHETLNSFIWGPDGWLYGCHGVFTSSMVGKPGAPDKGRLFIDGGIWRYHPTKKQFEVFARGLSNPWGFDFNDVGQGFASCCVIPHLFHIVQGGYYHKQSKAHLNPYVYDYITTIRDHTHLSAHGGARFYLADTFPKRYHDQLFMCNIHQHQVLTDVMKPSGSSYIGSHGEDFVTTNDLAWVGFSIEVGPDGGVYILDWHDTDICGNKINFPDSGRIYRLMPKGAKPIERPDIGALSDAELVAMQDHANDWYVRAARLNLQMRASNGKLDPETGSLLREKFSGSKSTPKRLRALWALHVTDNLDDQQLLALLRHEDEYVRAFAIQFLCEDKDASATALNRFAELAKSDPSPVVRLYLAAALRRIEHDQRWPILANLAQHSEDSQDNNIPRMLWFALEPMVPLHPEKSLELAVNGKLMNLREHVARRLVSGDLPSAKHRNQQKAGVAQNTAQKILQRVAPGFQVRDVGEGGVKPQPEFRNEFAVQTHPLSRKTPCVLYRHLDVPKGKATKLRIRASYHPHGNWQLRVLANKKVIHDQIVSYETVKSEWLDLEIDLSKFAGKHVDLEIENRANDWAWEFGFWGKVEVVSTGAAKAKPEPAPVPGVEAQKRPNILFCISDDQSYAHTGANGDPVVQTPGFDRIAREGLRFTHAFCDAPTCGPSRSAILTGQPIWRLEEAGNIHSTLPAKFATYTEMLKDAGYFVGFTGKGWSPGRLEPGGRTENPAGSPFQAKKLKPPFTSIRNTDYAGNFADFLSKKSGEDPFCFWLGTSEPHRGYELGSGKRTGKDPDKVIVPPIFPDNEIVRNDILDYLVEIEHFDSMVSRAIALLEESGQLDNTIIVVTSDHGMPFPRAKASLYDAGSRVPLAIRWPNGITNPGRVADEFVNLSDLAPTFLHAVGLESPKMMTAQSLIGIFGDETAKNRDAAFVAMERHDGCRKGGKGYPCRAIRTADYLYIHNFEPTRWPSGSPDPLVCARSIPYGEIDSAPTKTFMMEHRNEHGVARLAELAFEMRPAEELYDLKTDPHQMVNLAGSVRMAETQTALRKRLFDHLESTKDPRVVGGAVEWDYYPYYGKISTKGWAVDPKPSEQ